MPRNHSWLLTGTRDLSYPKRYRPALGPTESPTHGAPGFFPRVWSGWGLNLNIPSSTKAEELVALYLRSPINDHFVYITEIFAWPNNIRTAHGKSSPITGLDRPRGFQEI